MSPEHLALSAMFGFDREKKIVASGVRDVFTPYKPVSDAAFFFGRKHEAETALRALNTPGQHALVFGERGVGKSSLAYVAAKLVGLTGERRVFIKRCDSGDTFESIINQPLAEIGADLTLTSVTESSSKDGKLDLKMIKAGLARSIVATYAVSHSLSPSTVAEAIGELPFLLVVDEADAISIPERRKLAELVKLLSDAAAEFKILLVGIARTATELTAAHPSVQRCLREIEVDRMQNAELRKIITNGSRRTGLTFEPAVVARILQFSGGYPHFTHLIALKCAEHAIAEDRQNIDNSHLYAALVEATADADATFQEMYTTSVRSATTSLYRTIVHAAALVGPSEFRTAELRAMVESAVGASVPQAAINTCLNRLVSEDGSSIFRREAKGVYRFSDPRMMSYVLIRRAVDDDQAHLRELN